MTISNISARTLLGGALLGASILSLPLPSAAAGEKSNVFGYLGYFRPGDEDENRAGWYSLDVATGEQKMIWQDNLLGLGGTYFNVGWVRGNRLCGYYGNASQKFYLEFDLATGKETRRLELDVQDANAHKNILSGAYNPADDCIYGFSLNVGKTVDYFVKAPASKPEEITIVRRMPEDYGMLVSCCFSPEDNHMYGIDGTGYLIRVDVNGNFEVAGDYETMSGLNQSQCDVAPFESGMTYSPRDKAFIWNRHNTTYNSFLTTIAGEAPHRWTQITELPWWDQYTILYCPDNDGSVNGPAAPAFVSCDFPGGATSGSLVFRMPDAFNNITDAVPGTMKWTARAGDKELTGNAAAGETVKADFTDVAPGEVNFTVRADIGDDNGATLVHNTWIGADSPLPPSDVTLVPESDGKFRLSWKAPEKGSHNGYVDLSALRYAIFLDGRQVGAPVSECSATVDLPSDSATRRYSFQVMAMAGGRQSEFARSNYVYTGHGYDLPYRCTPTSDDAAAMTIINADDDRSNWSMVTEVGQSTGAFYSSRDWDNKGDDWLITPPLWFDDAASDYSMAFEVKFHNPNKAEEFYEVWVGTAPDADDIRKIRLAPKTRVNSRTYYSVSYDFRVPEKGTYYAGIRYVGDADQGGIYVRDINIVSKGTNGIQSAAACDEPSANGGCGEIILSAPAAAEASVFTVDGRHVARTYMEGSAVVKAEKGIYLVKFAGKTFKVYVK